MSLSMPSKFPHSPQVWSRYLSSISICGHKQNIVVNMCNWSVVYTIWAHYYDFHSEIKLYSDFLRLHVLLSISCANDKKVFCFFLPWCYSSPRMIYWSKANVLFNQSWLKGTFVFVMLLCCSNSLFEKWYSKNLWPDVCLLFAPMHSRLKPHTDGYSSAIVCQQLWLVTG